MKKWVNVELNNNDANMFRDFLRDKSIKFESSGCFGFVHFEVLADETEIADCNNFLDTL